MFLQGCVKNSVRGRGHLWERGPCMAMVEVCMAGAMRVGGMRGRRACIAGGGRRDGHSSRWYTSYWNRFSCVYIHSSHFVWHHHHKGMTSCHIVLSSNIPTSGLIKLRLQSCSCSSKFWDLVHCVFFSFHLHLSLNVNDQMAIRPYTSHSNYNSPFTPVADPGFSPGGGANSQKCYYFSIFCRKLHENERIWTPRGGARPWRPPLDPPMHTQKNINIFYFEMSCQITIRPF